MPDEHARALRELAEEHGTSVAAVIRAAVEALADDGRAASTIRKRIRPDPRGGYRPGAGRPRRTWVAASETAVSIREELGRCDEDFALRMIGRLVADLRTLSRPADIARCLSEPPSTGSQRWDVLLAVVVSRECRLRGIEAPGWTKTPPLPSWWFPLLADPILTARTMQRTPIDYSVRGIWLDANALETA
jgi:hypothetical protein